MHCQHIINIKTEDIIAKQTLIYEFNNLHDIPINEVDLYFVSNQNYLPTLIGRTPYHFEGQDLTMKATLGESTSITLQVSKYIYLNKTKELCRDSSYMKIILTRLQDNRWNNCKTKCHTFGKIGKTFQKESPDLPECQYEEDERCALDAIENIKRGIIKKPCTKIEYSSFNQNTVIEANSNKTIQFEFGFSYPEVVQVYEEVLLFDEIAMISSIGGTLGLCIGFAFTNISRSLISYAKMISDWIQSKSNNDVAFNDSENDAEESNVEKEEKVEELTRHRRASKIEGIKKIESLSIHSIEVLPENQTENLNSVKIIETNEI